MSDEKNAKPLRAFGTIVLSFLAGAMFVLGGLTVYNNYLPNQSKSVNVNQVANPASYTAAKSGSQTDIAGIVKTAGPAVVNIETEIEVNGQNSGSYFSDPFFRGFFGNQFESTPQVQGGIGTGFIINKEGYIITNEHVIDNASKIKVKVAGFEKPFTARVIGSDFDLDLAVIKIDAGKDLPYLALGDSNKTNVGDWVIAIGSPYGLDHTVTVGVISAKGRPITAESREYKNLLQTDAGINPGNSGGPLINAAGEVIGINTAVNAEGQAIGFAIPIATAKDVLKDLIEKGKVVRPYMGVYLQSLNASLAQYFGVNSTEGALIADVVPGSPAEKAGLRKGDIVLKANGKKIETADKLHELIRESKVNSKLELEVFRDRSTRSITIALGTN